MKLGTTHIALFLVVAGCGSSADSGTSGGTDSAGRPTASAQRDAGLGSPSPSATGGPGGTGGTGAGTSGDDGGSIGPDQGDSGGIAPAGDDGSTSGSTGDDASAATDSAAGDEPAPPACVKGQVTPDEVAMFGDSYLDPVWSNAAVDLFADAQDAGSLPANTTYRHYYIGGASMAWGNPNTTLYIPYQYDPTALNDLSVPNPKDIKVVILDGGGNDVLIGNSSCETTAPPQNTSCVTTIQNAVNMAQTQMQKMAANGVKQIVYFFYPHLDPKGGGILSTPAPAVNETLDYAYPLAEQVCCGTSFTSDINHYSCTGSPAPGVTCSFVDTRPAFEGHTADYIKSDMVHPTPAGAQVIADLIWKVMQDNCIAQ